MAVNYCEGKYLVYFQLRAVTDLDFDSLPISTRQGSKVEPLYQPPAPVPVGPVLKGSTEYNGNCHCGAVAYTLLSPEKISEVTDCNCSICSRVRPLALSLGRC